MLTSTIYTCNKHGKTIPHSNGVGRYRCAECNRDRMKEKHLDLRSRAIAYKGGVCSNCSYSKCEQALDFHHLDPKEKEFNISRAYKMSWDKLVIELDKCILLCANCHREVHAGVTQ